MKDAKLKQVNREKDIGVIVDYQLKFENHMYEKIRKTNNMLGLTRRSLIHLGEEMFLKLNKVLVHQHREYENSIWYPTEMKDIKTVEMYNDVPQNTCLPSKTFHMKSDFKGSSYQHCTAED